MKIIIRVVLIMLVFSSLAYGKAVKDEDGSLFTQEKLGFRS